jgi:hypothetical protein
LNCYESQLAHQDRDANQLPPRPLAQAFASYQNRRVRRGGHIFSRSDRVDEIRLWEAVSFVRSEGLSQQEK